MNIEAFVKFFKTDRRIQLLVCGFGVAVMLVFLLASYVGIQNRCITKLKTQKTLVLRFLASHNKAVPNDKVDLSGYRLTGIGDVGEDLFAIINDEAYGVNDKVGNYVVKDIQFNAVVLHNLMTNSDEVLLLYSEEFAKM